MANILSFAFFSERNGGQLCGSDVTDGILYFFCTMLLTSEFRYEYTSLLLQLTVTNPLKSPCSPKAISFVSELSNLLELLVLRTQGSLEKFMPIFLQKFIAE